MFAVFIRSKAPAPAHIKGQGINQEYDYQKKGSLGAVRESFLP